MALYARVLVHALERISSNGKSIANFGATYAATQEMMKGQATSLALIQDQLANL
jgi:hypothetical protein